MDKIIKKITPKHRRGDIRISRKKITGHTEMSPTDTTIVGAISVSPASTKDSRNTAIFIHGGDKG